MFSHFRPLVSVLEILLQVAGTAKVRSPRGRRTLHHIHALAGLRSKCTTTVVSKMSEDVFHTVEKKPIQRILPFRDSAYYCMHARKPPNLLTDIKQPPEIYIYI